MESNWYQFIQVRIQKELNCQVNLILDEIPPQILKNLESTLKNGLFTSKTSVTSWLLKSERANMIFRNSVKDIVIRTASKIPSKSSNVAYFDVDYSNFTLFFILNENYLHLSDG